MKKQTVLSTLMVMISSVSFCKMTEIDQVVTQQLRPAVQAIQGVFPNKARIIVKPITFKNSRLGGEASFYLQESVKKSLHIFSSLELIEDDSLKAKYALDELTISQDPFFNDQLRIKPGLLRAAQVFAYGHYWPQRNKIDVNLQFYNIETRTVIASTTLSLTKGLFPENLAFEPEHVQTTQAQLAAIDQIVDVSSPTGQVQIRVWPNRGDGATYRSGEYVFFYVRANCNGHLRLYHIDVRGSVTVLYPRNENLDDDLIRSNTTVVIPNQEQFDRAFAFMVSPPFGRDIVKAIFSTAPFSDRLPAVDLGAIALSELRGVLTRGITVVNRRHTAEDQCVFTTIP